jgi:hypothetical protein
MGYPDNIKPYRSVGALYVLLAVLFYIAGCSSDDDAPPPGEAHSDRWISITSPSDTDYASTYCNDQTVRGDAFISDSYYACCSGSATDTGVTVSWINLTTGISGAASQSVEYCWLGLGPLYVCEHTWSAVIPLVPGDNNIEVAAYDPGGTGGTDTITINKPAWSYELSGTLSTNEGIGLGYFQSSVQVELTGAINYKSTPNSVDPVGLYQFTCIPDGDYTITPVSNSFDYHFIPPSLNLTVAGSDISGLDFKSDAYMVSGNITWSTSGEPRSAVDVVINNTSNIFRTTKTDDQGNYQFIVPNGTYTITPSCDLCITEYYLPISRTFDVYYQGISGLDFVYYP